MKRKFIKASIFAAAVLSLSFMSGTKVNAAPLRDIPMTIVQPNGEEIKCLASGDEFFNWLHDSNGLIIIQDRDTGYYSYAKEVNGKLTPSKNYVTNKTINDKGLNKAAINAVTIKDIELPLDEIQKNVDMFNDYPKLTKDLNHGKINDLVVFIRFKGQEEFTVKKSVFEDMFNNPSKSANSLKNYYEQASYNKLSIDATMYPTTKGETVVSYEDIHPRGYYEPKTETNPDGYDLKNSKDRKEREHALLERAIKAIEAQVPKDLEIDQDGDGYVDNVCFIVKGAPGAWSNLLWPHMWGITSRDVKLHDKQVYLYNFQLESSTLSPKQGVGVLAHEMFHTLGAPDLYHYSDDGLSPAHLWDLMEINLNAPQHMTAHMKERYGKWIDNIPEITKNGTYNLNPLASKTEEGVAFKIRSPKSETEYFVVEYRKPQGVFDKSLMLEGYKKYDPNRSGLIVYRINTLPEDGNRNGPPDELYIFRPEVTESNPDGNAFNAHLSKESGRTEIGGKNNPLFFSDGTDSGIRISEIGSASDTISFKVELGKSENEVLPYAGWVDTPAQGEVIRGIKDIVGWCIYGKEISKIEVLVDGNVAGEATRVKREDVAKAYPGYDASKAGFKYALDTKNLEKGSHEIKVKATSADGTTTELKSIKVEVNNELLPYLGWVDTPKDGEKIGGVKEISGWYVYGNEISKIEILANGKVVGEANRVERKDVASVYPNYDGKKAGFKYNLDTSKLPQGENTISVRATSADGTSHELAARNVEVGKVDLSYLGWLDGPQDGETINGVANIGGWIVNNKEIKTIEVLVNGKASGKVSRFERKDVATVYPGYDTKKAGFNCKLDTTGLKNGEATIVVRATDVDGATFELPEVKVNIDNEALAYLGWIDVPEENAEVTGNVDISGWVIYGQKIDKVEILVDGEAVGTANRVERKDVGDIYPGYDVSKAGFLYTLNADKLKSGEHVITVRAIGSDKNNHELNVTVTKK